MNLFLLGLWALGGCKIDAPKPGDGTGLEADTNGEGHTAEDTQEDTESPPDTAPDSGGDTGEDTGEPSEPGFAWFFSVHAVEVSYDLVSAEAAFDHIVALGGSGVRTDLYWKDLEPSQDQWDASMLGFYDDYVSLAVQKGLEPMVIVSGVPDWAHLLYLADSGAFWVEFDAYIQEVVDRVADRVTHYQLWNEPNHVIDPIASEDDHKLFQRAGGIIRAVDPDAVFYANVLTDIAFWEEAVTDWVSQSGDFIDVIGIDHYPGTWSGLDYTDWGPLDTLVERINNPQDAWYGKLGAVMETGYSSWAALVADEEDQKDWIEQSLPELRSRIEMANALNPFTVDQANFYQLVDVDTDGVGVEAHFGIVHSDFSEKAGYQALASAIARF